MNNSATSDGYIFDIKKFAIHDGPGIRTTVFMKGCPLRCWWCHNPESLKTYSNNNLSSNENTRVKKYSVSKIVEILKKDVVFYDESGGGATFSGGEPVIQIDFLEQILKECKSNYITTTVDTSGFAQTNSFERIYRNTDLFLYDFKLFDDMLHKKYSGVSNQLIKNNLEYLNSVDSKIVIRIPLIPNITDTESNLSAISNYLLKFDNIQRIDLLPYNKFSEDKYKRLNQEPKLGILETQSKEQLENIRNIVKSFGHKTELNGH